MSTETEQDYVPADVVLPLFKVAKTLKTNTHAQRLLIHCTGPLHENGDKHPSGILTVTHDGTVLLFCNAGCDARDMLSAVGLELRDCFPRRWTDRKVAYERPKLSARDALLLIQHECLIVALSGTRIVEAAKDASTGGISAEAEQRLDRILTACSRIRSAMALAGVRP